MGKTTAIILFSGLISLLTLHPILRYYESRKEARLPYAIAEAKEWRKKARSYFSDELITNGEAQNLGVICRNIFNEDMLHNSMKYSTPEGRDIRSEFYELSNKLFDLSNSQKRILVVDVNGKTYETIGYGEDISNSDLGIKLDKLFEHYIQYLNSNEYKNLIKPKEAKERIKLIALGFLAD